MTKTIEAEELALTPSTAAPREAGQQEAGTAAVVVPAARNVAPAAPVAAQGQSGLVAMIERVALTPDVDVSKLEKLLDMQERILDREAEQAFITAMADAQAEMPQVVRDAENQSTRSRYSRLETIGAKIDPIISKHGFAPSFGEDDCPKESHYRVTCRLSHRGGHTRDYHADIPADAVGMKGNPNKTGTHAFGSTMSYGRRYLTLLMFDIKLKNEDDDGNTAGNVPITEEQAAWIIAAADEVGADKPAFCKFMGVKSIAEIPARQYARAKQALEAKKAAVAKQAKEEAAS